MNNEILFRRNRPVAIWLFVGVGMIIIQIILGGITRLTDSGLSITEWQPLLGTIPPRTNEEWNRAFDSYRQIAQYKHLHSYFNLNDFKSIFFWEWLHRVWGRLIGVVFIIPFVIFLLQKRFSKNMINPLLVLFLLGGLQGAIGWLMVKSGLNDENLYVSHLRLAIHFMAALILLVYTYWFALRMSAIKKAEATTTTSNKLLLIIIGLLCIQLVYGAFMAGLKAGITAPTWPDINGTFFPAQAVQNNKQGLFMWVNHPIAVQFIHRGLAYLLAILIIVWTVKTVKAKPWPYVKFINWLPLLLVTAQVFLGIASVLSSGLKVPQQWGLFEWYALLHQFFAMLLLLSLITAMYLRRSKPGAARLQ